MSNAVAKEQRAGAPASFPSNPVLRPGWADDGEIPTALTYAGMAPFLIGAAASVSLDGWSRELALQSLAAYGAVILVFIGAVHWGRALAEEAPRNRSRFVYSVVPALVAWSSLLLPPPIALLLQSMALAALLLGESGPIGRGLPTWYRRLRARSSYVVIFLLLASAFANAPERDELGHARAAPVTVSI